MSHRGIFSLPEKNEVFRHVGISFDASNFVARLPIGWVSHYVESYVRVQLPTFSENSKKSQSCDHQ